MNIGDYAQAKFEIADLLRTAAPQARERNPENHYPFEELYARLAEDRFNIAIVGQFSRGKTSLMNAMLNTDRLPTGLIPLTSVITTVQYGPSERAVMEYEDRQLPHEIPLDGIAEYVSQRHNPGNEKRIKYARVELPSELLRQGFFLVDTPGLGSAIAENTRTTENFLPEADAFILVTSYDGPLSSEEYRLLRTLKAHAYRTFLIVNKRDLVSTEDQQDADAHIRHQIDDIFGSNQPEIFSLSARQAMDAERTGDASQYEASGVPTFMGRLTHFLIEEKQTEFLRRLIERTDERLKEVGNCSDEIGRLAALRRSLFDAANATIPSAEYNFSESLTKIPGRFTACAVCRKMEQEVWDFLTQYQYRITIDRRTRDELSEARGLCAFHTWQYAAIASTHGTCIAFPAVLDALADHLAALLGDAGSSPGQIAAWRPTTADCILCRVCHGAEASALSEAAKTIKGAAGDDAFPGLCFPHLAVLGENVPDLSRSYLTAQVKAWSRVAEDMRRYALKRDGSRRALTTSDEIDSDVRGLRLLAGHRALSYTPPRDR
jgi:GTP-binding protein EngB required for normal cell division